MADNENNDWLAEYRKRAGYEKKKGAFAKAALGHNCNSRFRKWCKYETMPNDQTFERLAQALCQMGVEVTSEKLKKDRERGFRIHQRKQLRQTPIDPTLIANALEACSLKLGCDNYQVAAEKVLGCLTDETQLSVHLNSVIQQPLKKAIADSQTGEQLKNIRYLVAAIALSALVPAGEWKNGRELRVQGATRAWALRILIDDHNRRNVAGYDQKMIMTAIGAESMVKLDDASTRSVKIPRTKVDPEDLWGRLHEIVENLVNAVNLTSAIGRMCPALDYEGEHKDFKTYCTELNLHLGNTNLDSEHVFNYAVNKQPGNVTNELLRLLPNLRLFVCHEGETALPVLKVPERELESWIAYMLTKIKQREEAIKHRSSNESKSEEKPMKSKNTNVNVAISTDGGDSNVLVAANEGMNHQQIAAPQELGNSLREILKSIDADNPHHQDLRFDVEGMLAKEEAGEAQPASGKKRLEVHLKTLKDIVGTSDTLVKLVGKAINIWDKVMGVIS